jgi:hypothetical protein
MTILDRICISEISMLSSLTLVKEIISDDTDRVNFIDNGNAYESESDGGLLYKFLTEKPESESGKNKPGSVWNNLKK